MVLDLIGKKNSVLVMDLVENCIILGAYMSSSSHAKSKKNIYIFLFLVKILYKGINGTTIYAEKMYSINFTENDKKLCLSSHYNGANSYLFVNGKEIRKFKAKD